jgi:hypothetical protein
MINRIGSVSREDARPRLEEINKEQDRDDRGRFGNSGGGLQSKDHAHTQAESKALSGKELRDHLAQFHPALSTQFLNSRGGLSPRSDGNLRANHDTHHATAFSKGMRLQKEQERDELGRFGGGGGGAKDHPGTGRGAMPHISLMSRAAVEAHLAQHGVKMVGGQRLSNADRAAMEAEHKFQHDMGRSYGNTPILQGHTHGG